MQPEPRHQQPRLSSPAVRPQDEIRLDQMAFPRSLRSSDPKESVSAAPEPVPSILAGILGSDFEKLHPKVRERYAISSSGDRYVEASGVMEKIWSGSPLYYPFLLVGAQRNAMFPETGSNVPFRIENWAYRDGFGRETLTLNRTFSLRKERRFDEYVVVDPSAPNLVIYVGTHQHLAVELFPEVTPEGGLRLRTGRQRLFFAGMSVRFPLILSAEGDIREWYDDSSERLRIDGRVRNRILGDVFCCVGSFSSETKPVPVEGAPARVRPKREERRW